MTEKIQEQKKYEEIEKIEIDLLLEAIYRLYGYDFRNYADSFIERRIANRVQKEKLTSISALQEKILRDSTVMRKLFSDFSINVTEMFRDPPFFKSFRENIIPIIREYTNIRIWHVGCSTGEEVYSMAILLQEEGLYEKAMIYATDINARILERAKKGTFSLAHMQQYTKNYMEAGGTRAFSEYYKAVGEQVVFDPLLQKNIVFAEHNLVTDSSFHEFDIIICRNVLIYFNKTLQDEVHKLLYESLSLSGFLGLGKREGIRFTTYGKCYEEFDTAEKIYRKIQ
ncbi:CheR family methyltransferase [Niallia endozanthoxylica]|uniref:Protein-glutamate O-methyltransferase CheR n=1 Tax=Niallia endozanthoxylica TaxID=2036016 RepID=A0A5J5HQA0_9BACI|nr:protein-glutamate O-methyltransferase CheR [Niallia endozanthoxylica]KAA9022641.1 protein-glutamate O-methyltransferase CheR [Niallia endozanthoxylica]